MNIQSYIDQIASDAKFASGELAAISLSKRNQFLKVLSDQVSSARSSILEGNQQDLVAAKNGGAVEAFLDRLTLGSAGIDKIVNSLQQVMTLPDPIGQIDNLLEMPSGIRVGQMTVPIGVIAIIYESRPNVTIEAASLCIKSGNAVILRGGSEAIETNKLLAECITQALGETNIPVKAVQLVETTDRAAVGRLLRLPLYIDLIIPRGGKGLVGLVSEEATIPVIKHLDGNCHLYVDEGADLESAVEVAVNSKTQRYGTCNTMETLLVAQSISHEFLPIVADELISRGVEMRGCRQSIEIVTKISLASESDWYEEYLAPILAVRVVAGITEAIKHINTYGSKHTDGIITRDHFRAMKFLKEVDSSSVMVNASTRFADGFEYGLGAEIGISTDKFHARGPVGAQGLTSKKYVVLGNGEIRS